MPLWQQATEQLRSPLLGLCLIKSEKPLVRESMHDQYRDRRWRLFAGQQMESIRCGTDKITRAGSGGFPTRIVKIISIFGAAALLLACSVMLPVSPTQM